ncbi:methyltransferase domain-containing protein [Stieleria sp. JC731]|uniref:class I SAM-dependent methyltransferase n=1 Tax=Pirellulaceae TaxID=2691357 RepID=UPI001E580B49|nr:methyltransferase domain-containing protein [Stieleria sp. JC731]MCC9602307.1 methyltransferase domain-containing protein [Stieleria sp. JC731]
MSNYDLQTINAKNPIARYSHRTRVRHSIELAKGRLASGRILDYGCGSGVFVNEMNQIRSGIAYGYEPYLKDRTAENLPIYRDFEDVKAFGPFSTITLFETLEHLSATELDEFLERSSQVLDGEGRILISAPIEIGPALIMKELNRTFLKFKKSEHHFSEFVKAAVFAKPARRAPNIKYSHRGFDFRQAIQEIESRGWKVTILSFSPLPVIGWYGNSQVFMSVAKTTSLDDVPVADDANLVKTGDRSGAVSVQ